MRIIEFRIPLPIGIHEYAIAQLYNVAQRTIEDQIRAITEQCSDSCQFLKNEPFTSPDGVNGQYSEKILSLGGRFPKWIANLLDPEYFTIIEDSWNSYPTFKTKYRSNFIKKFTVEFHTDHLPGFEVPPGRVVKSVDEALDGDREIIFLDIVSDPTPCAVIDLKKLISLRKNWHGIPIDWMSDIKFDKLTAVKVFIVDLPMLPSIVQGRVENFVVNAMKGELVNFHRKIISSVDQWSGFELDQIRILEKSSAMWLEDLIGVQMLTCKKVASVDELPVPDKREKDEYIHAVQALQNMKHLEIHEQFKSLSNKLNPMPNPNPKSSKSSGTMPPQSTPEWAAMAILFLAAGRWRFSELRKVRHYFHPEDSDLNSASPDVVTLPLSNYFTNEGSTIWKLSNSWVSRSWSQRVMKIDGKYLRYFVIGSTSSYWEEEPRAELNLCGAKVQFTTDEKAGRTFGILLEHPSWLNPFCFCVDTYEETKKLTVQLQAYCNKLGTQNDTPETEANLRDEKWQSKYNFDHIQMISQKPELCHILQMLLKLTVASSNTGEDMDCCADVLIYSEFAEKFEGDEFEWNLALEDNVKLFFSSNDLWSSVPINIDARLPVNNGLSLVRRFLCAEPFASFLSAIILSVIMFKSIIIRFLMSRCGIMCVTILIGIELCLPLFIRSAEKESFSCPDKWYPSGLVSGSLIPAAIGLQHVKRQPADSCTRRSLRYAGQVMNLSPQMSLESIKEILVGLVVSNTFQIQQFKSFLSDESSPDNYRQLLRSGAQSLAPLGLSGSGLGDRW
eukprot:GHVH01007749.1.p1 GENE.GHVH01007749.1~~GHVH01007749.1.p1  ORF type:complete len:785 (+),score=101.37 GHVH01007749.1:34-2388(+)